MRTDMVGGDTSGYSDTGILVRHKNPASIIRIEITNANFGL